MQCCRQPEFGIARNQCDADLIIRYRRDIDFALLSPVQLHPVGPGSQAEVLPKCKTLAPCMKRVEMGPSPYSGIGTVGPDDPAGFHSVSAQPHCICRNASDRGSPE